MTNQLSVDCQSILRGAQCDYLGCLLVQSLLAKLYTAFHSVILNITGSVHALQDSILNLKK